MAKTLLTLRDIVVRYGERVALRVPRLDIDAGDVLAIIGPERRRQIDAAAGDGASSTSERKVRFSCDGENGRTEEIRCDAPAPDRNSVSGTAATKRDGL